MPLDLSDATMFPDISIPLAEEPSFPFPATDSSSSQIPTSMPLRHAATASQILIVDDNVINRKVSLTGGNTLGY
jgi:hypothetical protein